MYFWHNSVALRLTGWVEAIFRLRSSGVFHAYFLIFKKIKEHLCNKQKFIIFAVSIKRTTQNYKKDERIRIKRKAKTRKGIAMYLRKYRFYSARFKSIDNLNGIIHQIVNELKKDV